MSGNKKTPEDKLREELLRTFDKYRPKRGGHQTASDEERDAQTGRNRIVEDCIRILKDHRRR